MRGDTLFLLQPRQSRAVAMLLLAWLLAACASLPGRDALRVNVVDIDAAEGAGLELRFAVKLRLQNPNDSPLEYDGAALDLEVDGRTLASGVSDARGSATACPTCCAESSRAARSARCASPNAAS